MTCDLSRSDTAVSCHTCGIVHPPHQPVPCPRIREHYGCTAARIVAGLRRSPPNAGPTTVSSV